MQRKIPEKVIHVEPKGRGETEKHQNRSLSSLWFQHWGETIPRLAWLLIFKMEFGDKAIGFFLLTFSFSLFAYYTFWVIILPFMDGDHFVHKYFLPKEYAIIIPTVTGIAILSFLMVFIGFMMLKSKPKASWGTTVSLSYTFLYLNYETFKCINV